VSLATAKSNAKAGYLLGEASGSALDSVDSHDAADRGSTGTAAGMFGNGRDLEKTGGTNGFSVSDHADFEMADNDFTIVAWYKPESLGAFQNIVAKADGSDGSYFLLSSSADKVRIRVFASSGFGGEGTASSTGTLSTGNWHLMLGKHDATNNVVGASLNGAAFDTTGHSTASYQGTMGLQLGWDSFAEDADGVLDEVIIIQGYAFTDADAAMLWQGGGGMPFSEWDGTNDLTTLTPTAHFDASDSGRLFTTQAASGQHTGTPADGNAVQVWDNEYSSSSIADLAFHYVGAPDYRSGGSATMKSGLSELDFDGSTDYMIAYTQTGGAEKTWADFLDLDGWCLFGAFRADTGGITQDNTGNNRYLNHILTGDDGANLTLYLRSGAGSPKIGFVAAVSAAYTASLEVDVSENTTYYYILRYDGTKYYLSVNSGTESEITAGQIDSLGGDVRIGLGHASSAAFAGRFGEWGSFDYSLSAGNLTTLKTYLDRWLTAVAGTVPRRMLMGVGV